MTGIFSFSLSLHDHWLGNFYFHFHQYPAAGHVYGLVFHGVHDINEWLFYSDRKYAQAVTGFNLLKSYALFYVHCSRHFSKRFITSISLQRCYSNGVLWNVNIFVWCVEISKKDWIGRCLHVEELNCILFDC